MSNTPLPHIEAPPSLVHPSPRRSRATTPLDTAEVFAASSIRVRRKPRTIGELRLFRSGVARLRARGVVRGTGLHAIDLTEGGVEQLFSALGAEPAAEVTL